MTDWGAELRPARPSRRRSRPPAPTVEERLEGIERRLDDVVALLDALTAEVRRATLAPSPKKTTARKASAKKATPRKASAKKAGEQAAPQPPGGD